MNANDIRNVSLTELGSATYDPTDPAVKSVNSVTADANVNENVSGTGGGTDIVEDFEGTTYKFDIVTIGEDEVTRSNEISNGGSYSLKLDTCVDGTSMCGIGFNNTEVTSITFDLYIDGSETCNYALTTYSGGSDETGSDRVPEVLAMRTWHTITLSLPKDGWMHCHLEDTAQDSVCYMDNLILMTGDNTVTATTKDTTYYVSPTGSDSNDGLSESTPFKTIQHAIDILPQVVNHRVDILLLDGAHTGTVYICNRSSSTRDNSFS